MKLSTAVAERGQLEEELKDLVKTRAKMEMDMRDMEKRVAEDKSTTVRGGAPGQGVGAGASGCSTACVTWLSDCLCTGAVPCVVAAPPVCVVPCTESCLVW